MKRKNFLSLISYGLLIASLAVNVYLFNQNNKLEGKNRHKFERLVDQWVERTDSYFNILNQEDFNSTRERTKFYLDYQIRYGSILEVLSKHGSEELDASERKRLEDRITKISPTYFLPLSARYKD